MQYRKKVCCLLGGRFVDRGEVTLYVCVFGFQTETTGTGGQLQKSLKVAVKEIKIAQ